MRIGITPPEDSKIPSFLSSLEAAYHLALGSVKVDIFEKSDKVGGLLRYGIPDHKCKNHYLI